MWPWDDVVVVVVVVVETSVIQIRTISCGVYHHFMIFDKENTFLYITSLNM